MVVTLYREYPKQLCGRHPLRVYTGEFDDTRVVWLLGFPTTLFPEPVLLMAETDLYRFGKHVAVDEDYVVFRTHLYGDIKSFPTKELNHHVGLLLNDYNKVVNWIQRAAHGSNKHTNNGSVRTGANEP